MEDVLVPIGIVGILFIGLPWIIFHYVTQWKRARGLSVEDENLLDDPNWRPSVPDRTERAPRELGRDIGRDRDDWQGRA